jgi:hypothetical protein
MPCYFKAIAVDYFIALLLAGSSAAGQDGATDAKRQYEWVTFIDKEKMKVLGMHWCDENESQLWRMPAKQMNSLPKGVQARAKCPAGGRVLMRCTTTRLAIRSIASSGGSRSFDVYVNGRLYEGAASGAANGETDQTVFQDLGQGEKEIVIYLPHVREVAIKAIGVDQATRFSPPEHRFARTKPVVFYGSSVCQGSGAIHPGQTYEAVLCRDLNLDFVNLGFGGAGKAEPEVVALVNSIPACGYVFDLGKSYGDQDATAFKAMLTTVRRSHPGIPLVVITPITSIKEVKEPPYSERSIHTRKVMRDAAKELIAAGDDQLFLVEGEDLIGFDEHDALSKDGVHPSDAGYRRIAAKLAPLIRKALGL